MTEEQINEKALEAYPEIYVQTPYCMSTYDVNEDHRGGYKKALNDIESLPKIKGWVARCKWRCPQELYFYSGDDKPIRCGSHVDDVNEDFYWDFNHEAYPLPPTTFPELTWEDEPIEVELLIRKV